MKLWLQEMFGRCSCTQSGEGGELKGRCLSFYPSHCLLISICFDCIRVLHRISISLLIPISFTSSLNVAKGFLNFLSCMKVRTKNHAIYTENCQHHESSQQFAGMIIVCVFLSFRCTGAFIRLRMPALYELEDEFRSLS